MGPSVATPTIPQNAAASGERTFQANMFNPALLGGRGAGGGRRGHGLSRSLRVSETMLSILTLSDRKSTRLNSSHGYISDAVFCFEKKKVIVLDTLMWAEDRLQA